MGKLSLKAERIGIDTNIFIYFFEYHPNFILPSRGVFSSLINKKGVTSIITLVELLSFYENKINKEIEELFFNTPNLTILDVNVDIARESSRIRREYGLRLADSIQLATALSFKADTFITNDQRLKKFKEIKIRLLTD